jgi:hypothetical protein
MNTDQVERLRTDAELMREQQEVRRQASERARVAAEEARAVAEERRRAAADEVAGTVATLTALLERMEVVEEMRRASRNVDPQ